MLLVAPLNTAWNLFFLLGMRFKPKLNGCTIIQLPDTHKAPSSSLHQLSHKVPLENYCSQPGGGELGENFLGKKKSGHQGVPCENRPGRGCFAGAPSEFRTRRLRTLADPRPSACWFDLGGDQGFSPC